VKEVALKNLNDGRVYTHTTVRYNAGVFAWTLTTAFSMESQRILKSVTYFFLF